MQDGRTPQGAYVRDADRAFDSGSSSASHDSIPVLHDDKLEEPVAPVAAAPAHPITYRPDIDGLRTLAVVPVVLFHAYPKSLPGGFIGVDIFFVISGYLISSILYKENRKGKFTYADFYSRRIRRIFPGLLLMMVFTIVLGCFWYLAKPLKNMAATLWAGAVFGANIQVLSLKQGYFDSSIKENPLLHLWSLGVEEQFYIFWPLFASIIVKLSFRAAIAAQLVVLGASFALNIAMLGYGGNNNWSFYFPLCRFWQMSVGGLLAYINLAHPPSPDAPTGTRALVNAAASIAGVAMITIGFVLLEETSVFPGYWAILPTLGAAALVIAGPHAPVNRFILSLAPVVFVGKLSYAWYLWHWPLLVYAKAHYPSIEDRPWAMAPYSMVVLSFLLSVATLYLVENNLRRHKAKLLVPILFGLMMIIAALGIAIEKYPASFSVLEAQLSGTSGPEIVAPIVNGTTNGTNKDDWPNMSKKGDKTTVPTYASIMKASNDWSPDVGLVPIPASSPFASPTDTPENKDDEHRLLNPGQTNLVFCLGDSHMHMTKPRFNALLEKAKAANEPFPTMVFKNTNGQPPLSCMADHAGILEMVKTAKPKVVFYSSDWPQFIRPSATSTSDKGARPLCCKKGFEDDCAYQSKKDAETLLKQLQDEIADLTKAGIKVFVSTLNPEGDAFNFVNMVSGTSVLPNKIQPVSLAAYRKDNAYLIERLEAAVRAGNGTIIDFADNQCYKDTCEVVSPIYGEPIMKDKDHFRPAYAKSYLSVVDQVVAAALKP